jgi:GTP-binding protein
LVGGACKASAEAVSKVLDAQFVTTATAPQHYPSGSVPEIAFVGRSNVGKSSLINALAQRNKLVRVSNTPGRTRALNFFDVTVERKAAKRVIRLVDLPGYGYAKVAKSERDAWRQMIGRYLNERPVLRVVVSIIDAEVGPTGDDATMLDFLMESPAQVLVAATKIDRLGKAKRKPALEAARKALELPVGALVGVSSTERMGLAELWGILLESTEGKR